MRISPKTDPPAAIIEIRKGFEFWPRIKRLAEAGIEVNPEVNSTPEMNAVRRISWRFCSKKLGIIPDLAIINVMERLSKSPTKCLIAFDLLFS